MDKSRSARGQMNIMGDNCVERYLYNIPESSCMILVPGVSLLVTGGVLTGISCGQGHCGEDLSFTDFILLGLGAFITIAGIILTLVLLIRNRPRSNKNKNGVQQSGANLLSVKRISSASGQHQVC